MATLVSLRRGRPPPSTRARAGGASHVVSDGKVGRRTRTGGLGFAFARRSIDAAYDRLGVRVVTAWRDLSHRPWMDWVSLSQAVHMRARTV